MRESYTFMIRQSIKERLNAYIQSTGLRKSNAINELLDGILPQTKPEIVGYTVSIVDQYGKKTVLREFGRLEDAVVYVASHDKRHYKMEAKYES